MNYALELLKELLKETAHKLASEPGDSPIRFNYNLGRKKGHAILGRENNYTFVGGLISMSYMAIQGDLVHATSAPSYFKQNPKESQHQAM